MLFEAFIFIHFQHQDLALLLSTLLTLGVSVSRNICLSLTPLESDICAFQLLMCVLTAGVVDEDYRGNVGVVLFNFGKETYEGEFSQ